MFGSGGTRTVHGVATLIISTLLAGSLAGCAYEDQGDPLPTTAGASARPVHTIPPKDPAVMAVEARNYAELGQRLSKVPGKVLLTDSGPADGPSIGFQKAATVKTAGPYAVTLACVGIPHAQIFLTQRIVGGVDDKNFEIDCSAIQTRAVQLQEGYVGIHLIRHDYNGAWTGAVAGIKITAP
jgi:hypothetical protein